MRILLTSILIVAIALLAACVPIQPESPSSDSSGESSGESSSEVVTMYVGPELVDCVGVGPMKCMQVKTDPDAGYLNFYDQIDGFDYEEGYEYELIVQVDPVENPPADASSLQYTLIEQVDKQPVD